MKNYTSTVDVATTIWKIEQLLVSFRAKNISKDYDERMEVCGIIFTIEVPGLGPQFIRLPSSPDAVFKVLASQRKGKLDQKARELVMEQAKRTSWKLMQDWVEVQLSLIQMRQAEAVQVFLPFLWNGTRTFYQIARDSGFKALTHKPENAEAHAEAPRRKEEEPV